MKINAHYDQRAAVHPAAAQWLDSPMPGVQRCMLDRMGGEVARATSLVRYAPGSAFSAHVHTGGEEFLVLDGVFQDEHGDYPVGTYVRNPPTSRHTPASEQGTTILVKLWQFDPEDRYQLVLDTQQQDWVALAERAGVSERVLYSDTRERVSLEAWEAQTRVQLTNEAGIELLVLEGSLTEQGEVFERHAWLRLPAGHTLDAVAGPDGVKVWMKRDHLLELARAPIQWAADAPSV